MGKDVMVMDSQGRASSINVGKVIAGGLLCGLVINISETILNLVVVPADMAAALKERNLPELGTSPIIGFVIFAFLLGIGIVWLYAAIRPRFGPGVKTAIIAAVAVWAFSYVYSSLGMVFMGFFPAGLTAFTLVWGLVEVVLGAVAGAWVYKE
jgi:apolipoprotein N-acyltransferase